MAAMFRRMGRKTAKVAAVGGGAVGTWAMINAFINDDLDDIPYAFRRRLSYPWYPALEERKKVVVLGSGWGAISLIKKLDPKLYDVTVASPRPFFFYTPLLCSSTTGIVSPGSIIEPIRDVNRSVRYLNVSCQDVDLQAKKVHCTGHHSDIKLSLDYDHLVVAVGAQPNTFGIPGVEKNAMFLKEMEHGRAVRQKLLNNIEQADAALAAGNVEEMKRLLSVVVVGGGPTGVEFCGELSDFINNDLSKQYPKLAGHFKVTLVEALPCLLSMFKKEVGQHVEGHLAQQGVDVRLNAMVKEAQSDSVSLKLKDGSMQTIDYGMLVWVAGVGMRPFTKSLCDKIGKEAGQTDRRGLLVDECLRVKGTPAGEVFAMGDCAVSGKPPTAQVAAQQGKYLGRMFRKGNESQISDAHGTPFKYMHMGSMAYIGEAKAAAEIQPAGVLRLGNGKMSDYAFWRSLYGETDDVRVVGLPGFAIWRFTYFAKMYSMRGQYAVGMDWARAALFGRPAASSAQGTVLES